MKPFIGACALALFFIAVSGGCSRSAPSATPSAPFTEGPASVQLPASDAASASPTVSTASTVSTAAPAPTSGYYAFAVPKSWTRVEPPAMTKRETTYEIPRASPSDPPIALEHSWLLEAMGSRDSSGADLIEPWKKRIAGARWNERTQPIAFSTRAIGPGATVGVARVFTAELVAKGRAILAAIVDLSTVDARTRNAYARVRAATFRIEGPEARILAVRADFDALVRSAGLTE